MSEPTPLEIIAANTAAAKTQIDHARKANADSHIALENTEHVIEELARVAEEHITAAEANEHCNREYTAEAHRTIAQRLTAAAALIAFGRLEIK